MENPSIKEQIAAQNIINQMSNPTPPGPVSEPPTSNICPQCGTMHPPLQAGEKCPMARFTTKDDKVVNPTEFLSKMKFIISNQLEQKVIKDTEKFFQYLTVELMKAMENFKE